jgi:hypothetical protein
MLTMTAAFVALAGAAAAQTYTAAGVRIEHAAAVVDVITEDRSDIAVAVSAGQRLSAPVVRLEGGDVVIDGGLRNRIRGCGSWAGAETSVRVAGVGSVPRNALPRITLRVPRALNYEAGGAVFTTIGASSGGSVTANGCGDTRLGAASGSLDLDLNGSGDVEAGRVGGVLAATLNGSGSLRVQQAAGDAALRLNGSGDLEVGDVGGRLDARLTGSGSLEVGSADGDARLALAGSGDVEAGAIAGSLDADLRGSGSVSVASVTGQNASLDLSSSGDLSVRGGRVERLEVRNAGSGEVRFGGVAGATRASLSGSGDISVADAGHIEQLIDNGSGSVSLGR